MLSTAAAGVQAALEISAKRPKNHVRIVQLKIVNSDRAATADPFYIDLHSSSIATVFVNLNITQSRILGIKITVYL